MINCRREAANNKYSNVHGVVVASQHRFTSHFKSRRWTNLISFPLPASNLQNIIPPHARCIIVYISPLKNQLAINSVALLSLNAK